MSILIWVLVVSSLVILYVSFLTRNEDTYTWFCSKNWCRYLGEYSLLFLTLSMLSEYFTLGIPFFIRVMISIACTLIPYTIRDTIYTEISKKNGSYYKFKNRESWLGKRLYPLEK